MKQEYNTPRNRLALTYLTIIMVLSVVFSTVFYWESTRAAGTGFRRQANQLRKNLYFAAPGSIERIRDDGIDRFNNNVLARLILLNTGMFLIGGWFSYYLAKRSLEPLEDAIAAQSRFTSDAAHELRTPLTAMKTEIEVGLRSKKLDPKNAREILSSNLEEIVKLEILTEALLRLAKNAHQPDPESWQKIQITTLLKKAAGQLELVAAKKNIHIELPLDSKATVRGDSDQLVELFIILFENAIKYSNENTKVVVSALQNNECIVVKVADTGIGIAKADLPHIFDRFYRADQSRNKSKTSGYGLGLSVAEAIIKSHNGTITVDSKPHNGTTMTVTLPR